MANSDETIISVSSTKKSYFFTRETISSRDLKIVARAPTYRFRFFREDRKAVTFRDLITLLQSDDDFLHLYMQIFSNLNYTYPGYYWECKPTKKDNLDDPFECIIVFDDSFKKLKTDVATYKEYYKTEDEAISFWNLSKNCMLICPNLLSDEIEQYTHLGSFMSGNLESQKEALWRLAAKEFESILEGGKRVWFSVAGKGVYYLHLRLDYWPKYYKYKPYKEEFAEVSWREYTFSTSQRSQKKQRKRRRKRKTNAERLEEQLVGR